MSAESAWETYNQGPVGFQAIGSNTTSQPSVAIEGAPASMVAGTSVQLSARVTNDSPGVTWKAGAGTITAGGLYTAPFEPPVGGTVVVTATSSKGAQAQATIQITAASSKGLLVGDATGSYAVGDQTSVGREEAFQFTAKSSGTVEELQFRTDATADTGLTGVILGVLAESSGRPGEVLGAVKVAGEPSINSWIKATGLSVPVVSGTGYWLVVLPLGASGKKLYYDAAAVSGGTGNVESITGGLSAMSAESAWETYNQGPVGFQAIGSQKAGAATQLRAVARIGSVSARADAPAGRLAPMQSARTVAPVDTAEPTSVDPAQPSLAIAGAQSSIIAGTSVQLSAIVANDGPGVRWSASAGSIAPDGLYTAPRIPPVGGSVTVIALSTSGAEDRRTIAITSVPASVPAPAAPLSAEEALPSTGHAAGSRGSSSSISPAIATPEAVLVGRTLVLTTAVSAPGRARVSAYLGGRRLGSCVVLTPADRSFTCRVRLGSNVSLHAPLSISASLRLGGRILQSRRPTAPVQEMKMNGAFGETRFLAHGHLTASWQLICSPSLRPALAAGR
jgi:hypothetical protein